MHKGIKGRVVGLSIAAAMIATTTAMQADTTAPRVWDQCKVTTTDSIPIRSGSQDIRVTVDEELADPVTAEFEEDAKITVSSVTREPMMNTLRVSLDATEAVAGEYELTLRSGDTECTGTVKVGRTAPDSVPQP